MSVALKYRGVDGGILSWLVSVISDDQVPSWGPVSHPQCHWERRSRLPDPDTETEHCVLRPDISNITPGS